MPVELDLPQRAFNHVIFLAQKIGPRPAGSQSERQAFDYIQSSLSQFGFTTQRKQIKFAPVPRFFPLYALAGFAQILISYGIFSAPWAAVFFPIILSFLPDLAKWLDSQYPLSKISENLVAQTSAQNEKPVLILCAHVDSARANAFHSRPMLWLFGRSHYFAQRSAILIALLVLTRLAGFIVPDMLIIIAALIGCITGALWIFVEIYSQLGKPITFTNGAYDNASGVGVLMALAEYYSSHPAQNIDLQFLFSGAEETGMHGARAFAKEISPSDYVYILNLDMVGAGDTLRFVTKDGTIFQTRCHDGLNSLFSRANPNARGIWYSRRSGDYLPFLQNKIPATSIQTTGSSSAEFFYHTIGDKIDLIQIEPLEMTINSIINFINLLENSKMIL